jgi:glyoxylase-like metal-dependent hydrolase (beta-lactamase superfamily II)
VDGGGRAPCGDPAYKLDVLVPTARFVFVIEGGRIEVLPEYRSPQAWLEYGRLRAERPVVGMTTIPNTVLLRGPRTVLVDPGPRLQNEPVVRALEQAGLSPRDLDVIALTHAHDDHAGALLDFPSDLPVALHERETAEPHWQIVRGVLEQRPLRLLEGEAGELVEGVRWALTPGHTAGSVAYAVFTARGTAVLCGDTIGPQREPFLAMRPGEGDEGHRSLASWRRIHELGPDLIVPGHVPPFAP